MSNVNSVHASNADREPLLGRPGDAVQQPEKSLFHNVVLGTAALAQAGIWILAAIVWAAIFNAKLMLFSAHPLLMVSGLLFLVQGILILQPTHTAKQKENGTVLHSVLNGIGMLAIITGIIIIEYNKFDHDAPHFTSIHGKLGLVTFLFFLIQAVVGITQYYTPSLYGGVDNAKAIWKYHRMSGYIVLPLSLAAICAATQVDTNKNMLHIQLWSVIVTSVLIVVGIGARIHLQKLGLKQSDREE